MISIKNLTKEFSGQKVLDGIDIDIERVKLWLLLVPLVQGSRLFFVA